MSSVASSSSDEENESLQIVDTTNTPPVHIERMVATGGAAHPHSPRLVKLARRAGVSGVGGSSGVTGGTGGGGRSGRGGGRGGRGGGNRRGSGPRYSGAEVESFLELLEEVLPLEPEEWEEVVTKHNNNFPEKNRVTLSLRRKFQELYNTRVPPGDPECPPLVRKAKRIRFAMERRADVTNLGQADDNLPVADADLGFAHSGVDEVSEDGNVVARGSDNHPRPLARTPRTSEQKKTSPTAGGGNEDPMSKFIMATMMSTMRDQEAERQERREERRLQVQQMQQMQQQSQMQMAMMMAIMSSLNPAAARAMSSTMADMTNNQTEAPQYNSNRKEDTKSEEE